MNNDVDWTLLAKYLFGECTEEEEGRVRTWMERDPKRAALLRELHRALQKQEDPASSEKWDTEALWERVEERTQPEGREVAVSTPLSSSKTPEPGNDRRRRTRCRDRGRRRKRHRVTSRQVAWGGAIALLLTITLIGTLWQPGTSEPDSRTASVREANTFTTQKSERAIIRLTDGTRVQLNVDSRLTVPPDFGQQTRRIELEGEAFFEVATDSTRPFIVHSGDVTTRVLGTAFDVNAYPNEETRVVVSEGKVSLRSNAGEAGEEEKAPKSEERVVLTKQQMARITRGGNQIFRQRSDVHQHLAWMEGHLVLRKAPFEEVVRKLERWYDLEISLTEETEAPPGHLNSRFAKDQPLDEVLSVIATAFGLEYQRRQKHVTLSSSGNSPLQ